MQALEDRVVTDTPVSVESELIEQELPTYHQFKRAGNGGFAEVWHATNRETNEPVAVKFYTGPQSKHVNPLELTAWTSISPDFYAHPGLIKPRSRGTINGIPYVVMDWAAGEPLNTLANDQRDRLTWQHIYRVTNMLFKTLTHFNKHDLIHGDVTENQIVGTKLLDYDHIRQDPHQTNHIAGTANYVTLEEISQGYKTHTTDVAHGVTVVHKMLFGYTPLEPLLPEDPELQDIHQAFSYGIKPETPHDAQLHAKDLWNWVFEVGLHPDYHERPNAQTIRKPLLEAISLEQQAGTPIHTPAVYQQAA